MARQEHICVVHEDIDCIQTWIIPLERGQDPEEAMRKFVLESEEWPFNHWDEISFAMEADTWRCFRLVPNAEVIDRLKHIEWPETMDTGIDAYTRSSDRLAVFKAFSA